MPTIHIDTIKIAPDRQRQSFDDVFLYELAGSIEKQGLIHAIALDQNNFLVAGENRIRAIRQHLIPLGKTFTYDGFEVPLGHIPVVRVSGSKLELEEIELAENLRRKDLSWQELATTHARLHVLRQAQLKELTEAHHTDVPEQTTAATALEVFGRSDGSFQDTIRQEVIISQHLDKPEVAKAPTLKEAFKALRKIEDADRNKALALAVGETFSSKDHLIQHANCIEWMKGYTSVSGDIDVILTDPPYGMGAQDFGDAAGRLVQIDHQYDDSYESWQTLMRAWCPLSFAITKPEAHAYVFCDIDRFHELKGLMEQAGWFVTRTPFTNYKQNSGRVPHPDFGPRRQSEWLLYAVKGKKRTNFIGSDVIVSQSDENLTHGAQKPVALYEELLRRSVKPGDRVLDTFGGTGTLIPAAHGLKCRATVVEQSAEYYGLCLGRLEGLDKQGEMPV